MKGSINTSQAGHSIFNVLIYVVLRAAPSAFWMKAFLPQLASLHTPPALHSHRRGLEFNSFTKNAENCGRIASEMLLGLSHFDFQLSPQQSNKRSFHFGEPS